MDGNRRWAREQGLAAVRGHQHGLDTLEHTAQWVREAGVKHLAVFALSTENWQRSNEEVHALLGLFRHALKDALERLAQEGVRLHFIGDLQQFPDDISDAMRRIEKESSEYDDFHLWICASYGGQREIVAAAQAAQAAGEDVTAATLRAHLWSANLPDPDIIIRTGGEHRLSGFLLWHSAYAELFFPEVYWPAFTQEDLHRILNEYEQRERRYGK